MLIPLRAHRLALWLALSAMLLRALIPGGFMLGRDAGSGTYGLVLCSEQSAFSSLKDSVTHAQGGVSHCAFALSAMASVPGSALPLFLPTLRREDLHSTAALFPHALGDHLRPPPRAPPCLS